MAESIGGYDYEFLEDLLDDLTCTLCHFAYKQPVQIEDCGHTFCKECFNQMNDHAVANFLDLCCPLDRQKIDVARVFNVKSEERRVLNLMVKCPNFGDKCDWTGELREVLIHENTCCKNETMFTKAFGIELKQMLNRMTELESKMETNEQKIAEKDEQVLKQNMLIQDQNKEIEDLKKQNENQNKEIKELQKQMNNNSDIFIVEMQREDQNKKIVDQNKKIEDQNGKIVNQNKKIEDQNGKIVDQNKKIEDQNKKIRDQNNQIIDQKIQLEQLDKEVEDQNEKIMIIPVMESFGVFSPFQWEFNPNEFRVQGGKNYSTPFYNTMNSHCFQLGADFKNNNLRISYQRYRGKYDADLGTDIEIASTFEFHLKIFGKGGKEKYLWFRNRDYFILKSNIRSKSRNITINNTEINDYTIDGYLNLHCFFK